MDGASGPASGERPTRDEDRRGTSRQRRQARTVHGVTTLYGSRTEMRGVNRVADWFADSVGWTV